MQTLQITLPESVINDLESIKQKLVDLESNFTPKEPDDFLSRKETATLLKISLVTLHQWSNDGILRPMKMGNRTYFSRKEIDKVMYNSNVQ
mgnify:CR=1 FL=1